VDELQKSDILKLFAWIMYARRPLRVYELSELLSVREGDRKPKEMEMLMNEKEILELCCGLVVVQSESEILQFTHQTAQKFLQDQHSNDIRPKRLDIAVTCLT